MFSAPGVATDQVMHNLLLPQGTADFQTPKQCITVESLTTIYQKIATHQQCFPISTKQVFIVKGFYFLHMRIGKKSPSESSVPV